MPFGGGVSWVVGGGRERGEGGLTLLVGFEGKRGGPVGGADCLDGFDFHAWGNGVRGVVGHGVADCVFVVVVEVWRWTSSSAVAWGTWRALGVGEGLGGG